MAFVAAALSYKSSTSALGKTSFWIVLFLLLGIVFFVLLEKHVAQSSRQCVTHAVFLWWFHVFIPRKEVVDRRINEYPSAFAVRVRSSFRIGILTSRIRTRYLERMFAPDMRLVSGFDDFYATRVIAASVFIIQSNNYITKVFPYFVLFVLSRYVKDQEQDSYPTSLLDNFIYGTLYRMDSVKFMVPMISQNMRP